MGATKYRLAARIRSRLRRVGLIRLICPMFFWRPAQGSELRNERAKSNTARAIVVTFLDKIRSPRRLRKLNSVIYAKAKRATSRKLSECRAWKPLADCGDFFLYAIYGVESLLARNMIETLASCVVIVTVALDLRNLSSEGTASEQQRRIFKFS